MSSAANSHNKPSILVIGTADWDQAIATNQHYIVRELLRTYSLTYSESFGLRKPELRRRDIARMAKRLVNRKRKSSTSGDNSRPRPDGLNVVSPVIIPMHTGVARAFNKWKVQRLFREWISSEGPRILWTYTPLTYGLEKYAHSTIYHCVDLLGEFPGVSSAMIQREEASLARSTSTAIGSSEVVEQHLVEAGFGNVLHWPNVADVETILSERPQESARVGNRVVFAGNLSKAKIDFAILGDVIEAGYELHLAGPIAEGGGDATPEVQDLIARGAVYHGLLSLEELSRLYWTCSVGLIPYKLTPYTRGVNPLKTYEYLAAGMSVVSTAVPAVQAIYGHVSVITDTADIVAAITALQKLTRDDTIDARLDIAKNNSWLGRGEEARRLVADATTTIETQFI